jgi:hypothetical protein
MQTREAQLLCTTGALKTPLIRRAAGGWTVALPGKHGLDPMLERTRGGPRVFKTLDAAAERLFAIGFTAFRVERATPAAG